MAPLTTELGYAETPYGTTDYLATVATYGHGMQWEVVIANTPHAAGLQAEGVISQPHAAGVQWLAVITQPKPAGLQWQGLIQAYLGPRGLQFQGAIADTLHPAGVQWQGVVVDQPHAAGVQWESRVSDYPHTAGLQWNVQNDGVGAVGIQAETAIVDYSHVGGLQWDSYVADYPHPAGLQWDAQVGGLPKPAGMQWDVVIESTSKPVGVEYKVGNLRHWYSAYMTEDYLTEPYLTTGHFVGLPLQWDINIPNFPHPVGVQWQGVLTQPSARGLQWQAVIADAPHTTGLQWEVVNTQPHATGLQWQGALTQPKLAGLQWQSVVEDSPQAVGLQWNTSRPYPSGLQWRVSLYNVDKIRILCDFASRGQSDLTNWTANTTEPGDFSPNNINTDVVEQVWRSVSGVVTGIQLDCDTEVPQGAFVDTLAILNHNLTTSSVVHLLGDDNPGFTSPTIVATLQMRAEENFFWIAPELPLTSYRYWRFAIDDATNPHGFVKIGTIVFGTARIFNGECVSNPIRLQRQHFADTVMTEGFTNVSNDRGIKRRIRLQFDNLNFNGGNYDHLVQVFEGARTIFKCLWIPEPRYAYRYAVFGKLTELPEEEHQDMGEQADYVSFNVEVDEAR